MTRTEAIANAHRQFQSGEFLAELNNRVSYRTESQNAERGDALRAYLTEELQPAFSQLDFTTRLIESPSGKSPYLLAEYRENASLPTVLMYGHGDVVDGMVGEWRDNLDPWRTTRVGNRVYGRGTADNKGQHSINLAALRAVREARGGKLGFNAKFIIETGEEIGSPDLRQVCESLPRGTEGRSVSGAPTVRGSSADRPTIFLGCRGGIRIHLDVNLREGAHHSGNWGGVLANPATILANAIATLVDGHGPAEARAVEAAAAFQPDSRACLPTSRSSRWRMSRRCRRTGARTACRAAERLYAWNTLEVLAISSGNIDKPANAIPGRARAVLQLRFVVGTKSDQVVDAVRTHLHGNGFPMVEVSGDAELCRLANRFRQSLDQLGRGLDPADHRKGARGPAEFRRLAAKRRVFRCARPADDLGAALLSRLLAARAGRAHSCSRSPKRRWRIMAGLFWDLGEMPRALYAFGACGAVPGDEKGTLGKTRNDHFGAGRVTANVASGLGEEEYHQAHRRDLCRKRAGVVRHHGLRLFRRVYFQGIFPE